MRSSSGSFSSRFHWDSRPNALTALLAEKRRSEAPVLDLTESNPTRAGLAYPQEEILGALSDARALRYDPDPRGMLIAREAVSRYYAHRGVEVDPSRIILTASTSEAYSYLFKLLTDPGDAVLVPRPSYPLFEYLAAMESIEARQYPLRYDGVWGIDFTHLDFAALDTAADSKAARVRAIVIVNPNNPTGSYLKRDEWTRLAAWAGARGLAILSDEVFSDFALAPDPARIATLADAEEAPVFVMSGLSKTAGLPQMKLGWIVAAGPGHRAALEALEWIADTYLSVATPVQLGLDRILAATEPVRDQIRARTAGNLAAARAILETRTGSVCRILNVEGGWNIVIQAPRTRSEEEWALGLLRDADVLVQPGFFYDFESEACLVVSLLTEPVVFQEGIRRLSRHIEGM